MPYRNWSAFAATGERTGHPDVGGTLSTEAAGMRCAGARGQAEPLIRQGLAVVTIAAAGRSGSVCGGFTSAISPSSTGSNAVQFGVTGGFQLGRRTSTGGEDVQSISLRVEEQR